MGTPLKDRNRAEFKRYKEDVEREGKSFFPYASSTTRSCPSSSWP